MSEKVILQKIQKNEAKIKNKLEELQYLEEKIKSPNTANLSTTKIKSGYMENKTEDRIVKYLDLKDKVDAEIFEAMEYKHKIINLIELLPLSEYDFLFLKYVQGYSLYDIAERKDRSYSWATTMNGRAIKNFQKIIDERRKENNEEL